MGPQAAGYPEGMNGHTYDFARPALSVDLVVLHGDRAAREILLVRRGGAPFVGSLALPGGFVEEFEPPELAAARELREETGVTVPEGVALEIVGAYGRRGRDPRGWTVSIVYLADLGPADVAPAAEGGDDAAEASWWPVADLPGLAFDHDEIVADALAMVRVRPAPTPRMR